MFYCLWWGGEINFTVHAYEEELAEGLSFTKRIQNRTQEGQMFFKLGNHINEFTVNPTKTQ